MEIVGNSNREYRVFLSVPLSALRQTFSTKDTKNTRIHKRLFYVVFFFSQAESEDCFIP